MLGRVPAAAVAIAACAILAVALAGCGSGGDPVTSKVEQFVSAVRHHDYVTICDRVLAPSLLADLAQGGVGCEQAMQIALARVSRPRLVIGRIAVSGNTASALALATASGEAAVLTSIELVKTQNGWRVSALRAPVKRPG
jgi:hypothetical protein